MTGLYSVSRKHDDLESRAQRVSRGCGERVNAGIERLLGVQAWSRAGSWVT